MNIVDYCELIWCLENIVFMYYMHISWKKEMDEGSKGTNVCFLEEFAAVTTTCRVCQSQRVRE